jgi:hypothetical protein
LGNVKKIFSSETAWPNGAKLGRKHLCKVLYKVSLFRSVWPYIEASCQVWLHLAKQFQRKRFLLPLASQKKELRWAALFVGRMESNEEAL